MGHTFTPDMQQKLSFCNVKVLTGNWDERWIIIIEHSQSVNYRYTKKNQKKFADRRCKITDANNFADAELNF